MVNPPGNKMKILHKMDGMLPRPLFLSLTLSALLLGCRQDGIQTYLAPKEQAAGPEMTPGMTDMPPTMGERSAGKPTTPQWTTPEGWQEQPASSMRVGSFLIKGSNGQTADVSVVPLSGDAGGDLANINRWRGQIQLTPFSEEELVSQSQKITLHGRPMRWVDFVSEKPLGGTTYLRRITAIIYKSGDQTWFFKMTGDDVTVRAAQPAFRSFVSSMDFHDAE
jgi:hypothetical protein